MVAVLFGFPGDEIFLKGEWIILNIWVELEGFGLFFEIKVRLGFLNRVV